jgi:GNAT superfamily N-acetyltransferase
MTTSPITLRPLRPADVALAQSLVELAGWNQTEPDWLGYLAYEPDGCWLAEVDGVPAGTATVIRYDGRVGWIGMVLVHPNQRRRGVGTALLRRAIDHLQRAGVSTIKLDATPAGKPVYEPLGFRDEYELRRYEGFAPDVDAPPRSGVARFERSDLPAMAAFDREAFGVDRRRVLETVSEREPAWCFVVRRGTGVRGYLLARAGRRAMQVGPWVAEDATVAEDLWRALAAVVPGQRLFVDLPAPNAAGNALLERQGLVVQRPFTRMVLGPNETVGLPERIYSTAGAEKG